MAFKPLNKTIHAYLDYPVAFGLIALPFVLGLGAASSLPVLLSVVTGVAALILTLLTDHQFGVIRIIPFWLHELVDAVVGLSFLAIPFVFGFSGIDSWYYLVLGGTVVLVLALTNRAPEAAAETVGQ
jgi:hypothetical protein